MVAPRCLLDYVLPFQASVLEIYNEEIRDLLGKGPPAGAALDAFLDLPTSCLHCCVLSVVQPLSGQAFRT